MDERQDLCTSFSDLRRLTNMTETQLLAHTWKFKGRIKYTSEESVLEFLQHKASHVPTALDVASEGDVLEDEGWISIDLSSLATKIRRTGACDDAAEARRKRPQKKGVRHSSSNPACATCTVRMSQLRVSECMCYKNALEELNRRQRAMLNLENYLLPLREHATFSSWVRQHTNETRDKERL